MLRIIVPTLELLTGVGGRRFGLKKDSGLAQEKTFYVANVVTWNEVKLLLNITAECELVGHKAVFKWFSLSKDGIEIGSLVKSTQLNLWALRGIITGIELKNKQEKEQKKARNGKGSHKSKKEFGKESE